MSVISVTSFGQYATTGSGSVMAGCNEFEITPDNTNQTGSMHSLVPINLATSFSLLFKVNFGCDDSGGEGIAFVLQPGVWATGAGTFGMGYQGLTNTVAVEFDTKNNNIAESNYDIAGDHISIMSNGGASHNSPACLTGLPLDPISTFTGDVEDCEDHLVEIIWTAGVSQTLEVKVDGATSITHTSNMILNDLGGVSLVNWGWTGSTGVFSNQQTVQIALCPAFDFSATNCPGQLINFTDNSVAQNTIVQWDWDFDGTIVNNGGPTPNHTFVTSGIHPVTLTVTDDSGCTSDTTIEIGVGFEVNTSTDDLIVCPGTSTIIHVEGTPYVGNSCCFQLHCYDIWDDGWGGTEVEIYVDGVLQGSYSPPALGNGGPITEIFDFCWDTGSVIDLTINGTPGIQPQESSVFLINQSGDTIAKIESDFISGSMSWFDGATAQYIVDCGVVPPSYTYLWDNAPLLSSATDPDPTATLSALTTFTVDVTDPNTGCVISASVNVDVFTIPTADLSGTTTICDGADANLTIDFTGPGPYDIIVTGPGGPINLNGIVADPYTLVVQDDGLYTMTSVNGAGCDGTVTGTGDVTVIVPPTVDIEANATYCQGDPINALNVVSVNGGTVDWYDNVGLIPPILVTGNAYTPNPSGSGTFTYYAVETEGVLGCQGPSDMVTIIINPVPAAPNVTGQTVYCFGETGVLNDATATLGGTISWYDNPPPATVLSTFTSFVPTLNLGIINIYVTETANGCESAATLVSFTVKPTPIAPTVTGTTLYCEGDIPTNLTASQDIGGQISWETTSNTVLATGTNWAPALINGVTTYWVYEELNGCQSDSTEVIITVDPAPEVSITPQISICYGDSVQVSAANNGYDITWSNGQTGETVYLGPEITSWVTVTATNPLCGFDSDSIQVIVNPLPAVIAGNDTLIGIGGEVTLWANSPGTVIYTWVPAVDECIETNCSVVYDVPDQATVYVVFATDQNGCLNSDSVLVDINGYMDVFVPNIFSPNGDGFNDYLEVFGPRLFNYQIEIYDRWGKRVFRSDEQKDFWDGTLNGSSLSPQTFVYMLSGETVLGERIVQEGNISIIK
jgi:gliding motility-associated-like protein